MLTLAETSLENGIWRGQLTACVSNKTPELVALHDGVALDAVTVTATPGAKLTWDVTLALPSAALSEGTQVFLITDAHTGDILHRITIIAGHPATEDLRAEVQALRAELDQLRAAFRAEMRARTPS